MMNNQTQTMNVNFSSKDNEEVQEKLLQFCGGVKVNALDSNFNFAADFFISKNISISKFTLSASSVELNPNDNFYGLTVPLQNDVWIKDGLKNKSYNNQNGHLLSPQGTVIYELKDKNCSLFGINLSKQKVNELCELHDYRTSDLKNNIDFDFHKNMLLINNVRNFWFNLKSSNDVKINKNYLSILEENIICSLLNNLIKTNKGYYNTNNSKKYLKIAEEFIHENIEEQITRSKLAEVAGISIRTLSRTFNEKYGMGTMEFITKQKLYAAYNTLLSSNGNETNVTKVASKYGFYHLSNFSRLYKMAIKELPSKTLSN